MTPILLTIFFGVFLVLLVLGGAMHALSKDKDPDRHE